MSRTPLIAVLLVGFLATAGRMLAATAVIVADRDATIFQNNPDHGSGAGNGLYAGTNGARSPRRALVSFDLSGIPAGAAVDSVELSLTLGEVAGMGGGTPGGGPAVVNIGLHRLLAAWGEGATQQHQMPTDSFELQGQGAEAEEGDVTWDARFYHEDASDEWAVSGGDFIGTASSARDVAALAGVPYAWPSTAALVHDVQCWLTAPATNHGWILVNADETSQATFRAFYSSDVRTSAFFPTLTVIYSAGPALAADFEGDRAVGGGDFLAWQRGVGIESDATAHEGDATCDGAVSAADLTIWRGEFGTARSSLAAVPEPAARRLAMIAVVALGGMARRRLPTLTTIAGVRRLQNLGSPRAISVCRG